MNCAFSAKLRLAAAGIAAVALCELGLIALARAQQPVPAPPPAEAAPASAAMTTPAMAGPLVANPNPFSIDAGPLGKVYLTGAGSGLFMLQSNAVPGDRRTRIDISNAHVIAQTTEGLVQFYVQAGMYSFPALGTPYLSSPRTTGDFFSPLPVAYVKIAPNDTFSVQAGKLFTLIGAEQAFTFQNMNIERGLLWNQEPVISRGIQGNYTADPLTVSVSINDGFYSDSYNWLSGSAAWAFNKENTLTFAAGGNFGHTSKNVLKSPFFLNNSQIYNIIYTYSAAPWTITPYFQYTRVPALNGFSSASTVGGAILASYAFTDNLSVAARGEYISSTGNAAAPNLLFGQGSSAWSVTLTPTYQQGIFFSRIEGSFVQAISTTPGSVFGRSGNAKNQARFLLEAGIVF
jgi:hypothetical protein